MRRVLIAVIAAMLAAPVAADAQSLPQGPLAKRKAAQVQKEAERKKRERAVDEAYQKTLGGIPDQQPKPADPWANMR